MQPCEKKTMAKNCIKKGSKYAANKYVNAKKNASNSDGFFSLAVINCL